MKEREVQEREKERVEAHKRERRREVHLLTAH